MSARSHLLLLASLLVASSFARAEALTGDAEAAEADLRVLVMPMTGAGVPPETLSTITGVVTVALSGYEGLDVSSAADLAGMANLAASRQAMGCDDDGCLTELAGAVGARLVVFGQVGVLGKLIVLNLNLLDADAARAVGRATVEAESLEALPQKVREALDTLLSRFLAEGRVKAAPAKGAPVAVGLLAAGGASALVGGVLLGLGAIPLLSYQAAQGALLEQTAAYQRAPSDEGVRALAARNREVHDAQELHNGVGVPTLWAGGVLVGLGLACAVTGGALFALPGEALDARVR